MRYEYKVVPAPRRGEKARGVKTGEARFALAMTGVLNAMATEGWNYLRAETLPLDERSGLTGTKTSFQALLVFRRPLEGDMPPPSAEAAGEMAAPRLGPANDAPTGTAPVLGPAGAAP